MTPPEDGNDKRGALGALGKPFGYHLERDAGVPVLRRPGGSTVAAIGAGGADPFEAGADLREDAD